MTSGPCITATSSGITQDTCGASIFSEWSLRSENLWPGDPDFSLALVDSGLTDGSQSTCLAAANASDSNHTALGLRTCLTGPGGYNDELVLLRLG